MKYFHTLVHNRPSVYLDKAPAWNLFILVQLYVFQIRNNNYGFQRWILMTHFISLVHDLIIFKMESEEINLDSKEWV